MSLTMQELRDTRAMLIKINTLYRENMTDKELYDAVRWCWRVDVRRAEEADVVLGVAHGIVVAVYHKPQWERVTQENYTQAPAHCQNPAQDIGQRSFFTCEDTSRGEDDAFYGKHIPAEKQVRGMANPVSYWD